MNQRILFFIVRALFVLLFVNMSLVAAQAQTHPDELENRDGKMYLKGEAEPFSGKVAIAGQLEGQLEDGVRAGHWVSQYPNGNISSTSDYTAGALSAHAMFYPNGQKRFEGTYIQGDPDGVHTAWDQHGSKLSETHYADGDRHGPHKIWANGKLTYTVEYVAGKLHGAATWWYDMDTKRWSTFYEAGQRTGTWTQWHVDGRVLAQSEWKEDKLIARQP